MPNIEHPQVLYVADVARLRGISRSAARAWLATLEKQHGEAVVRRIGRKLCTTERGLAFVLPGGGEAPAFARRLSSLERRVERLTHRLQSLAGTVHDLREWVTEHRASRCGEGPPHSKGANVEIDIE